MEKAQLWEAAEEEEEEEKRRLEGDLRRRRPRQQSHTTTNIATIIPTTTTTTTTTNVIRYGNFSETANETESYNQEYEDLLEGDIYSDNDKGIESAEGFSGQKGANAGTTISKTNSSRDASSLPPSRESIEQWTATVTSSNNGITEHANISPMKDKRVDETELYLEKLYEKPGTHEFVCPNCKTCIKKVIVRSEWETSSVQPPETVDPFTCTSCFSFLIPAGNWFLDNLGPRKGQISIEPAETGAMVNTSHDPSISESPLAGKLNDQDKSPLIGTPSDQNIQGQVLNKVPSAIGTVGTSGTTHDQNIQGPEINEDSSVGNAETTKPREASEDNAAYPEKDPAQLEVVIDRGIHSSDAEKEQKTEESKAIDGFGRPWLSIKSLGAFFKGKKRAQGLVTEEGRKVEYKEKTKDKTKKEDKGPIQTELPESPQTTAYSPETPTDSESRDTDQWEIIKSILYGGLTESIASLSVVTSAASADATTLNIIALSLANLISGLFLIGHNLWELKNEQGDRYQELLGQRKNFKFHAPLAVLSFLVFGLVPPMVYGFSFRESNNRDFKVAAVAAASLLCIAILAILKAYVQKPPKYYIYIKTVIYYVVIGVMASGISYVAGNLIKKLIDKLGWFSSGDVITLPLADMSSVKPISASY